MTDSHEADAAAMQRLKVGDDLALNELMERWQAPLLNYLLRFCGNDATGHDLAQETFVRVYEARNRYDARSKFSTWLFTIAGNLARNAHRWAVRHPNVSLETPLGNEGSTLGSVLPDENDSPDDVAQTNERAAAVRAAIADLPDEQRSMLLLSEFEGLEHAEVAKIHGCTAKAVETRLYRARQILREKLGRWLKS